MQTGHYLHKDSLCGDQDVAELVTLLSLMLNSHFPLALVLLPLGTNDFGV